MIYKIEDIVQNDLCVGCGICISESESSRMEWNEFGFLIPKLDGSFNEKAIKICPFNPSPEDEVKDEDALAEIYFKDSIFVDERIGRYENTYIGFSKEYRAKSSSGGIATFIFKRILETKIANHLFIVKEINGTYVYQMFSNVDQIEDISKTRYIPVTLENFFKEINSIEGKVAVSGVACFVKAIRLKQYYNPLLQSKISFVVGIICGGLKSNFFTDYLAQNSGIKGEYSKQEYRIKDANSLSSDYSFGAFDENEMFHQVKMKKVGDMWGTGLFKANACDFCTDVTTELADISLGDAWLKEYKNDGLGNSIIIARSAKANDLIKKGILDASLDAREVGVEKIIESQKGSFTHRQDTLKCRIDALKNKQLIPNHRKRLLKESVFSLRVVQYFRRITRKKSLEIWMKNRSVAKFDEKMKKHLFFLKIVTKLNHKLRRF